MDEKKMDNLRELLRQYSSLFLHIRQAEEYLNCNGDGWEICAENKPSRSIEIRTKIEQPKILFSEYHNALKTSATELLKKIKIAYSEFLTEFDNEWT